MKANFNLGEITHITLETSEYTMVYIVSTSGGFAISFMDDVAPENIVDYTANTPFTKCEYRHLYIHYEWEVGEEI